MTAAGETGLARQLRNIGETMPKDGKRKDPVLRQTRAEIRSLIPDARRLLKFGSEFELMQFLRGIGIKDEDSRFGPILKIWRDLRSGRL